MKELNTKAEEFKKVTTPIMKWLNENFHPHVTVVVTPTSAELSIGEFAYETYDFVED